MYIFLEICYEKSRVRGKHKFEKRLNIIIPGK
jgi:hypothetical protein